MHLPCGGIYTVSQKNIHNIFECNWKTNYRILIILGINIPDTTCHQMAFQFPTLPNVCFCTTWGQQIKQNKQNMQNLPFLANKSLYLSNIARKCLGYY